MALFINNSGWKSIGSMFVNVSGSWRKVSRGFVNVAGSWRVFFSSGILPTIAQQVIISQSTNSTSGLITLTGRNYHWTNFSSAIYEFQVSSDATTWTTIDSGSITNPSTGSSNTKTYLVKQSDLLANNSNDFRFVVTAISSTSTENSSTSATTTIEMPRDITNLSVTSQSTSSIYLSWTASQYAGSQVVEYKQNSSSEWSLSSTQLGSTSDLIVSGLSPSTTYNFRILPWTGSSANIGYYGNYSNTATGTTTAAKTPNAVRNLTASNIQTTYLTFSWDEPLTDSNHDAATYYYYDWNTNGATPTGGYLTFNRSVTLDAGTLSAGTTYYIWVQSYNGDGAGPWTYITVTTQTGIIIPGQVTGLSHNKSYTFNGLLNTLTRSSSTVKIQSWEYTVWVDYNLSWSPATNAAYYEITSNSVNSNPGVGYYTTYSTSYTDRQFQSNRNTVTSYYWVRAISSTGHAGAWSAVTGGTSTATVTSGWSLLLIRCNTNITTAASAGSSDLSYTWTGVSASFTHSSRITGTIAGTSVTRDSAGCV